MKLSALPSSNQGPNYEPRTLHLGPRARLVHACPIGRACAAAYLRGHLMKASELKTQIETLQAQLEQMRAILHELNNADARALRSGSDALHLLQLSSYFVWKVAEQRQIYPVEIESAKKLLVRYYEVFQFKVDPLAEFD